MEQGTGETVEFEALGKRAIAFTKLETFAAPRGLSTVVCLSDEMTAVCPVTSQPDWYKARIEYKPNTKCVESKTLKLYLQKFRNKGMFCERLAATIAGDLATALQCSVKCTLVQKSRGGISITAEANASP